MSHPSNDETNKTESSTGLSLSECHRLLASEQRRFVLDVLAGNTTPIGLEELSAGIAARKDGIETVDDETIERMAIELHHNHLPRLDEAGLIEYEPDNQTVDPTPLPNDPLKIEIEGIEGAREVTIFERSSPLRNSSDS